MNWNIQFLAGEYYPYWSSTFDKPPLTEELLDKNLDRIVEIIRQEQPDILQLQEVLRSHPITFYQDQLDRLYQKLKDILPCYSYGSYWKPKLVPQKNMMGPIDLGLVTMSRYQLDSAQLERLPATRNVRVLVPFYPRHSLMETQLPLENGERLTLINTHLDAPTLQRGKMGAQIFRVYQRLTQLTNAHINWLLTGDFNLIPPGFHEELPANQQHHYAPKSPLVPFYQHFTGIPAIKDVEQERSRWLTAYDLNTDGLDLIVDYIFHPHYLQSQDSRIRHLPLDISDHMPVITTIRPIKSHSGTAHPQTTDSTDDG
ncbi:endonuclease/exonuclease/phosphatase family protein [Parendozoicomonas haliclonae]|uniref:Endonuclease/Exonuclease/phosphatase family protein n=2 Tax=Parendozoicomonas haliclonae TaxID=1960125 RepID=A0A1X7AFE8_9GAMM|nr:Endonuclease/Exonuclease/phosphatase family protein [Parendozoicomonas haliclonae]